MMRSTFYLSVLAIFLASSCKEDSIEGCMNSMAENYMPSATINDESCIFLIEGCTDSLACNFNYLAEIDDTSCEFPPQGYDCLGNIFIQVGDSIGGGIVFYVNNSNVHGLLCGSEDLGSFEWGCYNQYVIGADGTSVGSGFQNSLYVVNDSCSSYFNENPTAAEKCLDYEYFGNSDWYLPSQQELLTMYSNIGQGSEGNIGNFANSFYWSSSQSDSSSAFAVYFNDGVIVPDYKNSENRVRPIRAF
tara:strand:+ start:92 stop:829 length:738 start_codon:yes stop_codon:yes gene_type:complete